LGCVKIKTKIKNFISYL